MRPFDNHKRLVEKLHIILDEASVEYDRDCDVVDDFVQYVKDWETRRSEQEEIWRCLRNCSPSTANPPNGTG